MFLPIVNTSDTTTPLPYILHIVHRSTNTTTCGFVGNNDIDGIGIRIGIYTQIIAVWFASHFLSSEAQVLRDSVSIFSVALLVVSLIFASDPSDVYAAEAFIVLQILAWTCLMSVDAKSSYTAINLRKTTLFRSSANDTINLFMVGLHVWFWWTGLGEMKETPCGTFMMYMIKTDMFGWARKAMKGFTLLVLGNTVYRNSTVYLRLWFSRNMEKSTKEFVEAVRVWEEMQLHPRVGSTEKETSALYDSSLHDGYSQSSCSRSTLQNQDYEFGRAATLIQPPHVSTIKEPAQNPTVDPISPSTLSLTDPTDKTIPPELSILREVYERELFIQHCLLASPFTMKESGRPIPFLTIIKSICSPKKYHTTDPNVSSTTPVTQSPSWLECHLQIMKSIFTFRFTAQSFAIYAHLRQADLLDPLNGPFQVHASLNYPTSTHSSRQSTSLASSLLITRPDTPKKVWLGWYYMLIDLVMHVVVILQVELTLVWNNVSGLSTLWTSIGQLIPFVIGVGGLALVAGRWVERRLEKVKGTGHKAGFLEERDEGRELFGLEEGVREAYARWKVVHEAGLRADETGVTDV